MRRPRAAPLVLRRNALTRRPPFYALVVLLFMAVFRNLDLPKLTGKHAEAVSEAIKMRRRNTIQRDAMHAQVRNRRPRDRVDGAPGLHQIHAIDAGQRRAHRAPRPRVSASDEEPP